MFNDYLGIHPIYPDKLIRIRLLPEYLLPSLVKNFAASTIIRKEVESLCATTVGNWGISATSLKTVRIPIPPFAEQVRIVAALERAMGVLDELAEQTLRAENLRAQLLSATFVDASSPVLRNELLEAV